MDENVVRSLVSMALITLQEQGNEDAVSVIRRARKYAELDWHDNWDGGIDYYVLILALRRLDYLSVEPNIEKIKSDILDTIKRFNRNEREVICNCDIRVELEEYFDWANVLPHTKEDAIRLIQEEKELLEAIATKTSYKEAGLEQQYEDRHKVICSIAERAGFDYPIKCNSLPEWWQQIKVFGSWAERIAEISRIFAPLIERLEKPEETAHVEFIRISDGSAVVKRAVNDANYMIGAGRYESAVDRVHTAFHGYLRDLAQKHGETGLEDANLPALYGKLHNYYARTIQPENMAEHIRLIIRAGGSMVQEVNDIRNHNTTAHPNNQLIQRREAELVIHLVNAVVNYIDAVEHEAIDETV